MTPTLGPAKNAGQLHGVNIKRETPLDGQVVMFDETSGEFKYDKVDLNNRATCSTTDQTIYVDQATRWNCRDVFVVVKLPDNSLVLTGAGDQVIHTKDVWRSTDNGVSWVQQTANAEYGMLSYHASVVLSDGTILVMGGSQGVGTPAASVWKSVDKGVSWTLVTDVAGFGARNCHTAVVFPNDDIVLMGGSTNGTYPNDSWISQNKGVTWTCQSATAGWEGRVYTTAQYLSDGSIVLMGGYDDSGGKNDVWRSTDKGINWVQQTASAEWLPRDGLQSVVLSDDTLIVIGGYNETGIPPLIFLDVWKSIDKGVSWTKIYDYIDSRALSYGFAVVAANGDILVFEGCGDDYLLHNEIWRSTDNGASWTKSNQGATWETAFSTIQAAIDSLQTVLEHDITIKVRKGTTPYADDVTIQQLTGKGSLTIEGEYYWRGVCVAAASPAADVFQVTSTTNMAIGDTVVVLAGFDGVVASGGSGAYKYYLQSTIKTVDSPTQITLNNSIDWGDIDNICRYMIQKTVVNGSITITNVSSMYLEGLVVNNNVFGNSSSIEIINLSVIVIGTGISLTSCYGVIYSCYLNGSGVGSAGYYSSGGNVTIGDTTGNECVIVGDVGGIAVYTDMGAQLWMAGNIIDAPGGYGVYPEYLSFIVLDTSCIVGASGVETEYGVYVDCGAQYNQLLCYNNAIIPVTDDNIQATRTIVDTTIYVSKDATGTNDGTSWETAFLTIQDAIDSLPSVLEHDVTIYVRKGTTPYADNITIQQLTGKGSLTIRGEYYWNGACVAADTPSTTKFKVASTTNISAGDEVLIYHYDGDYRMGGAGGYKYYNITTIVSLTATEVTLADACDWGTMGETDYYVICKTKTSGNFTILSSIVTIKGLISNGYVWGQDRSTINVEYVILDCDDCRLYFGSLVAVLGTACNIKSSLIRNKDTDAEGVAIYCYDVGSAVNINYNALESEGAIIINEDPTSYAAVFVGGVAYFSFMFSIINAPGNNAIWADFFCGIIGGNSCICGVTGSETAVGVVAIRNSIVSMGGSYNNATVEVDPTGTTDSSYIVG